MTLYIRLSLFLCGMVIGVFYHDIKGYESAFVSRNSLQSAASQDFQYSHHSSPQGLSHSSSDTLTWQDRSF